MCGNPLYVVKDKIGIDKDGFPKVLLFLKEYFNTSGSTNGLRWALTILNVSRSCEFIKTPDLSSITNPGRGDDSCIKIEFLKRFVRDFNLDIEPDLTFSTNNIFFTLKAGPLGNQ
jgi:hypothetical protein